MKAKSRITRRSFVTGATLGAVGTGLRFPAVNDAAAEGRFDEAKQARPEPLRLNRNESPYGLPPGAIEAIQKVVAGRSNRYPGDEATALTEAIAKKFGVDKEEVLLGCGSTEILRMATEAFCSPSRAAVVAEPTFEAVANNAPLVYARAIRIPVTKDYQHNMALMWGAAKAAGGLIFFCNPSNPTGTFIDKTVVERYVRRVPRGVVLLADEAYWDYVEDSNYESCVRYVKEGRPIVVSRTFSKVYGMAGLRLGYAIGRKDLIKRMTKRRMANNPNQAATAAGMVALRSDDFVAHVRKLNAEARDYLCSELRNMGLNSIPSQTNFVMANLGRPAEPVIEALKKKNVLVGRMFPAMPQHLRVSIGTRDEMKGFLKEFRDAMVNV